MSPGDTSHSLSVLLCWSLFVVLCHVALCLWSCHVHTLCFYCSVILVFQTMNELPATENCVTKIHSSSLPFNFSSISSLLLNNLACKLWMVLQQHSCGHICFKSILSALHHTKWCQKAIQSWSPDCDVFPSCSCGPARHELMQNTLGDYHWREGLGGDTALQVGRVSLPSGSLLCLEKKGGRGREGWGGGAVNGSRADRATKPPASRM